MLISTYLGETKLKLVVELKIPRVGRRYSPLFWQGYLNDPQNIWVSKIQNPKISLIHKMKPQNIFLENQIFTTPKYLPSSKFTQKLKFHGSSNWEFFSTNFRPKMKEIVRAVFEIMNLETSIKMVISRSIIYKLQVFQKIR